MKPTIKHIAKLVNHKVIKVHQSNNENVIVGHNKQTIPYTNDSIIETELTFSTQDIPIVVSLDNSIILENHINEHISENDISKVDIALPDDIAVVHDSLLHEINQTGLFGNTYI